MFESIALALLAGRPMVSKMRKDGRSQRMSLANNLPADAADRVVAVHGTHNGRGWAWRQAFVVNLLAYLPAKSLDLPYT
jgi:hypothetical protein